MGAHHAPRRVARTASALGTVVSLAGIALAVGFSLGAVAFGAQTHGSALNVFLWGEGGFEIYSPPLGELLGALFLLLFGALITKVSPRVRRSEHGIPTFGPAWKIKPRINEVRYLTAYPQRRIGRRMLGFGIPAVLSAALTLLVYAAATGTVRDEGLDVRFGATLALIAGIAALAAALAAVVAGVVFLVGAPSAEEVKRAETLERSAPAGLVMPTPPPPPMPGAGPPASVPPPPPAPA